MPKDMLKVGSQSQIEYVQLSSTATGGPLTGLAHNSAGLKCYYTKEGAAPVAISLVTQTPTGAYTSGGFCEVDATNCPGLYRIDLPNTAINTGRKVIVTFSGATNLKEVSAHYQLVAYNPDDSASMGLSKFDSVALSAAGVLAIWHQLLSGIVTANTIGKLISDNLNATISSRSTLTAAQVWDALTSSLTTNGSIGKFFMDNWTAARAAFLDKLNISGLVASQADINALNQSASRRILVAVVPSMERPESGSNTYTIEVRLWTADGVPVNADADPTITATGRVTGSLTGNISGLTNTATGVYRATYTVANNATLEEVRIDVSAAVSTEALQMSALSQVADFVAATFTTTDRADIQAAKVAALAAQTRAELGIPAAAPGTANGLPRVTDLPVAPDNAALTALSNKFAGITLVSNWLRALSRKGNNDATAVNEINANNGTGTGTYDPATDSPEAIRDRGDAAWTTGGGGGGGGTTVRLLATPLRSGRSEAVRYTRGATGPDLRDWLTDASGNRINLTGYAITASMIRVGSETPVFTDAAASLGPAPDEGQVELVWPDGALDSVGQYKLIWEATKDDEVLPFISKITVVAVE